VVNRGVALEALMAKIAYAANRKVQIVAMSATLSNIPDLCRFLDARLYHGAWI
jgi:replicative superfamily II helicase